MNSQKPSIIFFGSFLEYSANVLKALHESDKVEVVGVITTPPKPAGRKQILTKTHVHEYAESQNIPVYTPEKLNDNSLTNSLINNTDNTPDLFVVAGYGKLLPKSWLQYPKIAPVNIHFSLLPKYRGAMPGEWAIFMGETETGVSLIEMSPELDTGNIFAQDKYQLKETDNRETLYHQLYKLGAELFLETIEVYLGFKQNPAQLINSLTNQPINQLTSSLILPPKIQTQKVEPYARLINKDETFIPWELILTAMDGKSPETLADLTPLIQEMPSKVLTAQGFAQGIERLIRAMYGWPGVWTKIQTDKGEKRMKIHTAKLNNGKLVLEKVQVEGKQVQDYSSV